MWAATNSVADSIPVRVAAIAERRAGGEVAAAVSTAPWEGRRGGRAVAPSSADAVEVVVGDSVAVAGGEGGVESAAATVPPGASMATAAAGAEAVMSVRAAAEEERKPLRG